MKNYIIIGAFDLISHDNIYQKLLEEDDYKVIFVEPIPLYYNKLINNCSELKGQCFFENTAISNQSEIIDIEYVNKDYLHIYPSYIDGCSSVVEQGEPINRYLKDVKKEHRSSIKIQAITFEYLINKYNLNTIDYLQIDTEGYDERIVRSIDLNKYKIKKLKFEHHYINKDYFIELKEMYPNYKIEILDSDIILEL
jgi:FkbM family methyltransferase